MQYSVRYILMFAAAVCVVCSVLVSGAAVTLKSRQEANKVLDQQKKVLDIAGLLPVGASAEEVGRIFGEAVEPKVIDLETGEYAIDVDARTYDQQKASRDPDQSSLAPANAARVRRLPKYAQIFHVTEGGKLKSIILPIEGYGLWSTLYGYLALAPDSRTIQGITYYQHGETAGLGGEVDNPRWKALWPGRKAFDEKWKPVIWVKKGVAGPPDVDPYEVDGLSGATITSKGVGNMLRFWLGERGFGPYLARYRSEQGIS